jgi:hypothetical protein
MNDEDYPPVEYPAREAFTMGFAAIMVLALVGWTLWELIR